MNVKLRKWANTLPKQNWREKVEDVFMYYIVPLERGARFRCKYLDKVDSHIERMDIGDFLIEYLIILPLLLSTLYAMPKNRFCTSSR